MNIKQIIEAILDCRIWITDHADEETNTAILVTVYRPDPKRWINRKIRRH